VARAYEVNASDNAACESFLKTLKYEEVYLQDYRTLGDLLASIEHFLQKVYNDSRLCCALGYRMVGRVAFRNGQE
jgi:hypothetical protein